MSSTHKCNNGPTPQQEQVKGAKKVFFKNLSTILLWRSIVEERQNNLFHLYLSVAEYLVFVFVWHIWRIVPPAGPECPSLRTIASPCYTPPSIHLRLWWCYTSYIDTINDIHIFCQFKSLAKYAHWVDFKKVHILNVTFCLLLVWIGSIVLLRAVRIGKHCEWPWANIECWPSSTYYSIKATNVKGAPVWSFFTLSLISTLNSEQVDKKL